MTHPAQTACLPARVLAGLRGRLTSSQGTSPRASSAWRGRRALPPSAGRTDGWGGGDRLLVWTRAERQSTRRGTRSRRHLPGTQHLSTAAPSGSRRHTGRRTQDAPRGLKTIRGRLRCTSRAERCSFLLGWGRDEQFRLPPV